MKNTSLKKRYLLKNPKEAVGAMLATSSNFKKMVHQLYIAGDGVLGIFFSNKEEIESFENLFKSYIKADVSLDERYKNRCLKLFGLPSSYDFDLYGVYAKCLKIGVKPFEINFMRGMSSQKVFRILLFRELQFLEYQTLLLLDSKSEASKKVAKITKNIISLLDAVSSLFDEVMLSSLSVGFSPLLGGDKLEQLEYLQSDVYQRVLLDMRCFLYEESGFYLLENSEMPLYLFLKKELKAKNSRLAKKIKKVLY